MRNSSFGNTWGDAYTRMASKFASTQTSMTAATFQMYVMPQRLDKLTFAGTSTMTFAVVNAAKIIRQLGQLTETGLHDAAVLIPVGIAGTFAGAWMAKCPSSNALGQSELYWKGGSGSLGLEFRRLSTGVAIVAV